MRYTVTWTVDIKGNYVCSALEAAKIAQELQQGKKGAVSSIFKVTGDDGSSVEIDLEHNPPIIKQLK